MWVRNMVPLAIYFCHPFSCLFPRSGGLVASALGPHSAVSVVSDRRDLLSGALLLDRVSRGMWLVSPSSSLGWLSGNLNERDDIVQHELV